MYNSDNKSTQLKSTSEATFWSLKWILKAAKFPPTFIEAKPAFSPAVVSLANRQSLSGERCERKGGAETETVSCCCCCCCMTHGCCWLAKKSWANCWSYSSRLGEHRQRFALNSTGLIHLRHQNSFAFAAFEGRREASLRCGLPAAPVLSGKPTVQQLGWTTPTWSQVFRIHTLLGKFC